MKEKLHLSQKDWDLLLYEKERLYQLQCYVDNYDARKKTDELEKTLEYKKQQDIDLYNSKLNELRDVVSNLITNHYDENIIHVIKNLIDRLERILWNEDDDNN